MADFRIEGVVTVDTSQFVRSMTRADAALKNLTDDMRDLDRAIDRVDGRNINITTSLRDDADLIGLAAKISALDGRNINLDVDVDGTEELAALHTALNNLSDRMVDVGVDVNGMEEFWELERRIEALDGREIDLHIDTNEGKLAAIHVALNALSDKMVDIGIDINGMEEFWELERKIEALDGREIDLHVDTKGIDKLRESVKNTNQSIGDTGFSIRSLLIPAIAALIVAAAPIVPVVAGGLLAVGAGAVTAGTGLGAFALFAIPTIESVKSALEDFEENGTAAFQNMSQEMIEVITPLVALKDRFKELTEALQPEILNVFHEAVHLLATGLEIAYPIAEAFAPAIARVVAAINTGLKNDEWSAFFGYVTDAGPGLFEKFSAAVGNFVTGLVNLIVALDPITQQFTDGFLNMSESFRNWSANLEDNQGFQKFISFVQTEGPAVMNFLGSLIGLLWDLIKVLAPAGADLMRFLTPLMETARAWIQANPEGAKFAATIALISASIIPLIGPLSNVAKVVGLLAGGGMGFAAAAAAGVILVGALSLMFAEGDSANRVFEEMKGLWEQLKETGAQLKTNLEPLWEFFKSDIFPVFNAAMEDMVVVFRELEPLLGPIATIVGVLLTAAFIALAAGIKEVTGTLREIAEFIGPVIDWIAEKFQWLYDKLVGHSIVPDLINGIIDWFAKLPGKLLELVTQAAEWVMDKFTGLFTDAMGKTGEFFGKIVGKFGEIPGALRDKISSAKDNVLGKFGEMYIGVNTKVNEIKDSVKTKFEEARHSAATKAGEIYSQVSGSISGLPGKVAGFLGDVKNSVVTNFETARHSASAKASDIYNQVTGSISGLPGTVGGFIGSVRTKIADAMEGARHTAATKASDLYSGVSSKMGDLVSWFAGLPGRISSAVGSLGRTLYYKGQEVIQGLISGIGSMVGNLARATGNAVKNGISRLIPGSPVKEGPLTVLNNGYAGGQISKMIADGITENERYVQSAMSKVVDNLSSSAIPIDIGVNADYQKMIPSRFNPNSGDGIDSNKTQNISLTVLLDGEPVKHIARIEVDQKFEDLDQELTSGVRG